MGGHSRTNLNTIDENQIGADKRDELLTIADNTFNQPLRAISEFLLMISGATISMPNCNL